VRCAKFMTEPLTLYKPALYSQSESGEIALLGGRCECGYVFFPMQQFGCERCGRHGNSLQPHALRGRGTLIASATVHLHADKRRIAPFVVGTIALDDGPVVRTLLTEAPLRQADAVRVMATLALVKIGDDASEAYDLRFQPIVGSQT
jgi:uncharacterized OB-fold protein